MGQWRKAIFIGRADSDTALTEYRRLAKRKKIRLDIFSGVPNAAKYIPGYDIAFVSGYLSILEALAAGVPVLAIYNTDIKKDYLLMAPFAEYIQIFSATDQIEFDYHWKRIVGGKKWAKAQTWDKLADMYEQLWQK